MDRAGGIYPVSRKEGPVGGGTGGPGADVTLRTGDQAYDGKGTTPERRAGEGTTGGTETGPGTRGLSGDSTESSGTFAYGSCVGRTGSRCTHTPSDARRGPPAYPGSDRSRRVTTPEGVAGRPSSVPGVRQGRVPPSRHWTRAEITGRRDPEGSGDGQTGPPSSRDSGWTRGARGCSGWTGRYAPPLPHGRRHLSTLDDRHHAPTGVSRGPVGALLTCLGRPGRSGVDRVDGGDPSTEVNYLSCRFPDPLCTDRVPVCRPHRSFQFPRGDVRGGWDRDGPYVSPVHLPLPVAGSRPAP